MCEPNPRLISKVLIEMTNFSDKHSEVDRTKNRIEKTEDCLIERANLMKNGFKLNKTLDSKINMKKLQPTFFVLILIITEVSVIIVTSDKGGVDKYVKSIFYLWELDVLKYPGVRAKANQAVGRHALPVSHVRYVVMFRAVTDGWKRYWWGTGILPDRTNRVEDIYLRFYNGKTAEDYVDIPLFQADKLLEIKGFEKSNPTVLYIHGFIETAQQESVQVMVNAYLEARPGTNILLLDWSNMSHGSYLVNAARNTKKVGSVTAEKLNTLIGSSVPVEKFHIIGHSLGGHVAGYAARELKNRYSKTVKRLTALDPAFPAFYPDGVVMEHVNAKDAEFVDVIHTDAGVYGAPVRTGTVDFWPNGGKSIQPGCPRFAPIPLSDDNLCSHWRSWHFYAESVRNPEAFPASPATSYQKFKENPNPETGMIYMGLNCDTSAQGSYYLTTNGRTPFGKGMDGLYPKNKKITNSK